MAASGRNEWRIRHDRILTKKKKKKRRENNNNSEEEDDDGDWEFVLFAGKSQARHLACLLHILSQDEGLVELA